MKILFSLNSGERVDMSEFHRPAAHELLRVLALEKQNKGTRGRLQSSESGACNWTIFHQDVVTLFNKVANNQSGCVRGIEL
jgi:hypothetical protein